MSDTVSADLIRLLHERRGKAEGPFHRRCINPAFADYATMAGYGREFVEAHGLELEDTHGNRYLDFVAGYGSLNLGHNHPGVKGALAAVIAEDSPSFAQVDFGLLEGLAAEALLHALPAGLGRVFFCNSGSEAVEAALKLARAATGRSRFIACDLAYHGLTLGTLSLNGNTALQTRFRPLIPGCELIPFGDLDALERALRRDDTAAFVVEPILGEGGAVPAPPGFLKLALELCRKHRALLIADEVQTGMGRTGTMLAVEDEGIVPDVVTLAKSLGGGLVPVGAMVATPEAFDRAYGTARTCQDHGCTFGGGSLAMAAVLATLRILESEGLCANARSQGQALKARLQELASKHKAIREVRGRGLMLGIRFDDAARGLLEGTMLQSLGAATSWLVVQSVALRLMEEHHVVAQAAVNDPSVLKVMPPLSMQPSHADRFVTALDKVLGSAGHARSLAHLASEVVKTRLR